MKLFFSFPIFILLAWPSTGHAGPPGVSCQQYLGHLQNLQRKISNTPSNSDEYREVNWFKNYAALHWQQNCSREANENTPSSVLVCPPNSGLMETENILQFVEEWIAHISPIERRQALQKMEKERTTRCDQAYERATVPKAGESENQKEDREAAYIRDYAELCRTKSISRSPPGFPVAPEGPTPPSN